MSQQLPYQIALTRVPLVGAVTAKTLVSYCGSAEGVFTANRRELLKIPGIGPHIVDGINAAQPLLLAEAEMAFLEKHNVEAIFYTDDRYPTRLKQYPDCPAMLYFKGSDTALFQAERTVAIVGTRQPTDHGKAICAEIVEGLQPYGVLIVSGLAYGIDIAAHRQACTSGMPNIGVLGHGLATIYPEQHRSTAVKMLDNGGLLTEFTHTTGPDRENFPMRNRIIAGMCDALLVVETAATGGSMISASLAHQYERDVFAIPGRVRDAKSMGCNQLIKTNRAQLVESAEDLAKAMLWEETGKRKPIQPKLFNDLSPEETRLIDLIRQEPNIAIDNIAATTNIAPGTLVALLLGLEFKGLLRTLPGKRYVVA
jgi:DNA processing protein